MTIRAQSEALERRTLSSRAAFSDATAGRARPEQPCSVRTDYQRDRDRIIHSKPFRRLKYKTQVFVQPKGDHYRTRLTHTLEVAQIARTIARALLLNEDLVEAIALGHDLGHTPFGHSGEDVLNEFLAGEGGFRHAEQSLRVIDLLADHHGLPGINLTWEVRDGIANHSDGFTGGRLDGPRAASLEGQVVRFADKIAYINHDIDDAIRAGILTPADLPRELAATLGGTHGERLSVMVSDLIAHSCEGGEVRLGPEVGDATARLRDFLFERVYRNPQVLAENAKAKHLLVDLCGYFLARQEELPPGPGDVTRRVADYVAGMTDRYAVDQYLKHFLPIPVGSQ